MSNASTSNGTPAAKAPKKNVPKRERALVTGASGALGRLLCRRLHRSFDVIALDRRPFPERPKDVDHHAIDLRRKSAFASMRRKRPRVIIHLGVMHNPRKETRGEAVRYNLDTMSHILRLAERVKARKLIFLSTANLYGPSATSSGFLTEEEPLMGAGRSPEVRDLIALDMMAQSFFWKRPEIETVVLRPVHIVGPHVRNAPSNYFRHKNPLTLLGFDPMVQVIHETDVVEALMRALPEGVRGVFNVVGSGQAPLSRLLEARGCRPVPVPGPIMQSFLSRAFRLRLSTYPPSELDHLRYSCLVDGKRANDELGFRPRYGLFETVRDLD